AATVDVGFRGDRGCSVPAGLLGSARGRTGCAAAVGSAEVEAVSFLSDMERLGEAVERACRRLDPAFRRVNLEILGNTDPFLHVHVWPRFDWEPADMAGVPVWLYPRERWSDEQFGLGPQHDVLRDAISSELDRLGSMT
ncbi:LOW QUALITY PROTEIN: conserved hypothetical protein, partial [Streptomyces viridosporus ATCC 14672]